MTDSNDLAEDRTDWAEDRTVLANERTFAGWMRTGAAAIGVAIALKAIFGKTEPTWLAKGAASIFIVLALLIFWAAQRQSRRTFERLNQHRAKPLGHRTMVMVASLFAAGALATGGLLWLL